ELPHPLASEVELVADGLQRPRLALEPESELEDPAFALGQRVKRLADALAPKRLLCLVERIRSLAIGEEVSKLTLVVCSNRLVERDRCVRGAQRLVDVLHRKPGRLCKLVFRRLTPQLDLEPTGRPAQLLLAL